MRDPRLRPLLESDPLYRSAMMVERERANNEAAIVAASMGGAGVLPDMGQAGGRALDAGGKGRRATLGNAQDASGELLSKLGVAQGAADGTGAGAGNKGGKGAVGGASGAGGAGSGVAAGAVASGGASASLPAVDADAERAFCAAEESVEEPLYGAFLINARQLLDHERMTQLALIGDSSAWFAAQLRALALSLESVAGGGMSAADSLDGSADGGSSGLADDEDDTTDDSVPLDDDAHSHASDGSRTATPHTTPRTPLRRTGDSLRRFGSIGPAPVHRQDSGRRAIGERVRQTLVTLANQVGEISETVLFTLRTELRVHAFYHLDNVKKAVYELQEEQEPDNFITVLNDDLTNAERALSAFLPPSQMRYLFYRLPKLVCNILMRALGRHIRSLNRNGVQKMHKNLFLLQRALAAGAAASDAHFERCRLFFELTLLPRQELLDHARESANSTTTKFSFAEYRKLLQVSGQWPLPPRLEQELARCTAS